MNDRMDGRKDSGIKILLVMFGVGVHSSCGCLGMTIVSYRVSERLSLALKDSHWLVLRSSFDSI